MAHQELARWGKAHTRGQHLAGLRTQNLHPVLDEGGDFGIGGSQIDTYDQVIHFYPSPL